MLKENVMSEKENVENVEVKRLRKLLQRFNEDLGKYINDDRRYKLGRVLTIVDASIADPNQRKAIKDLVQGQWWSEGRVDDQGPMLSPHSDIRGLTLALGFELYPASEAKAPLEQAGQDDYERWATTRYKKVASEE
jgi:hypothetical protein